MRVGILSGSGSYEWPGLVERRPRTLATRHGEVAVTAGRIGDVEVVHVSRHGPGHARLSNQVQHRANLAALLECEVAAVISLTVCGAVDPAVPLGALVVFDELHFPSNRLPDGSLCTWYDQPGDAARGHWIPDSPFCQPLRAALLGAAAARRLPVVDSGCYGHVDGPRFNTRSEISAWGAIGVTAVSQTAGPEVVLAGEAELPLALVGYVTDYANGVAPPEPVDALLTRMAASSAVFAALVEQTLGSLPGTALPAPGVVFRFEATPDPGPAVAVMAEAP